MKMMKNHVRLSVEELENRLLPTTTTLVNGTLFINGLPFGNAAPNETKVLITAVSATQVTVQINGAGGSTTFGAPNGINLTGGNGSDSIMFDANGFNYTGTILINTANGNDTVGFRNTSATSGAILGNITILGQNGTNTTLFNNNQGGTSTALRFNGNISVTNTIGTNTMFFGNTGAATKFLGSLNTFGSDTIFLGVGSADTFGGAVTVGDQNIAGLLLEAGTATGSATVTLAKGLTVTTGAGDDTVFLAAAQVFGNLQANLGSSSQDDTRGNQLYLGNFAPNVANAFIGGTLNYSGSGGVNLVDFEAATIAGNAVVNLGAGDGFVALDGDGAAAGFPFIGGSLTITASGNVNFDPFATGNGIEATIAGNLNLNLGNGSDNILLNTKSVVGGQLVVNAANGSSHITLSGNTAQSGYNVLMNFGNGDNTVTMNFTGNPANTLVGSITGGTGSNTLQDTLGVIGSPFRTNFTIL